MTIQECDYVAKEWKGWCGENRWTRLLESFGILKGKIIWYTGYPQSKSAIPLCFELILETGEKIAGSRLKDIQRAIDITVLYRQINRLQNKIAKKKEEEG